MQRIVYAENECNYCAKCQTGGRLLADRSLSRLLKDDWPRSIDEIYATSPASTCNHHINTCRFIDVKQASALYRLLGDEARLRLLRVLARERLNVTELTGVLGLAQSGVSRHLGLLKDAGLVGEERDGGFSYYRLSPALESGDAALATMLRAQFERVRGATRRSAPTRRGCRRCCGCARRTSTRTAAPTPATRGSSCPGAAGPPGRARSAC